MPKPGGLIAVILPSSHQVLNGHLVEVASGGKEIVVLAPKQFGEAVEADPGDGLLVAWNSALGLHRVATELTTIGTDHKGDRIWRLTVEGPVALRNRRQSVRVPTAGKVLIEAGGKKLPAYLVDVSEGGFQCVLAPGGSLEKKAGHFVAPMVLAHKAVGVKLKLRVNGEVAWNSFGGSGSHIGVSFDDMSRRDVEKIRNYVKLVVSRHPATVKTSTGGAVTGVRRQRATSAIL